MDDACIGAETRDEQHHLVVAAGKIYAFYAEAFESFGDRIGLCAHLKLAGEEIFRAQGEVIDGDVRLRDCGGGEADGAVASDGDECPCAFKFGDEIGLVE